MIKFKKLPKNVSEKIPDLIKILKRDENILAFYIFGSFVSGNLKPLSDLDFALLLPEEFNKHEIFEKHLDLIGTIEEVIKTDEFDLVILNNAPLRFAYNILKTGRLEFCKNRSVLIDFIEKTNKFYLDFKYFREQFDKTFLKELGYVG